MTGLPGNLEPVLRSLLEEDQDIAKLLHKRSDNRGGLLRLPLEIEGSAIIKFWKLRNLKERIKSRLRLSNGRREWQMHRLIYKCGIEVPTPFAFSRMNLSNGDSYEVMVIEDLGKTERGLPYLKELLKTNDECGISKFENSIIHITKAFIDAQVLDVDHQLNNFVLDARNRLMRIDFECARRTLFGIRSNRDVAEMLGRLITSHVYAVQPEVHRSEDFAEQLFKNIGLGWKIKGMVDAIVNEKLEKQRDRVGITTKVKLTV